MSTPGVNRLAESLAAERDPSVNESELTKVGLIRRALFNGERLQPRECVERWGGSNGLLGQVTYQLEQLGFHVDRSPDEDGLATYRLTNPRHQPSEAEFEALRARTASGKAKSKKAPRKARQAPSQALAEVGPEPPAPVHNGEEHGGFPLPALPDFGQSLRVYALVLNDDETITIGLRNGTRKWTANLSGVIET